MLKAAETDMQKAQQERAADRTNDVRIITDKNDLAIESKCYADLQPLRTNIEKATKVM